MHEAATQSTEVIIQPARDPDHADWLADVNSYLCGNQDLRKRLLKKLCEAEDSHSLIRALLVRVTAFRGSNALDPAIDLLAETRDMLEQFLCGDVSELNDDAWYALSGAVARSAIDLSFKLSVLRSIWQQRGVMAREGVAVALGALAFHDERARPYAKAELERISEMDLVPSVREEAIAQLDDLP